MENRKNNDLKLGERGVMLSIIAYIALSIIKLTVGYISDSSALRADGLNSTTDIIASLAILIGLRISQKPPDKDHRYGHRKSETIASLIASLIILTVGLQVLFDAGSSMIRGGQETPGVFAAYTAVFSGLVMYFVYRSNRKLALKINNNALMAVAKDNRSDAWVSFGAGIGIFGAQLNMAWLDSLTAVIVGLLIIKTGWDIFRQSSHELSDGFDEEKLEYYQTIIEKINGVEAIKEIKGRTYGNLEFIDLVILVDSSLGIKEAHDIATEVENTMINEHGLYEVHVHVEPISP